MMKKPLSKISYIAIGLTLISQVFYSSVLAATYTFTQNSWTGGATANNAVHPTNQTGWNQYFAKDANLSASSALTLNSSTATTSVNFTTSTNFVQQDRVNGTSFIGGVVQLYNAGGGTTTSTLNAIPAMSSNATPSGVASASSEYSAAYAAWKAFDNYYSEWNNSSGQVGWLAYQFSSPKAIWKYSVTGGVSTDSIYSPKNWTFEGSNDGITWTVLDTETNQTAWTGYETRSFVISNTTTYYRYRLNVTATNNATYIVVGQLQMFPIITTANAYAASSYLTTSNSSQVNTSGWSHVSDINFNQTTPAGSVLKYLVSFDGRTTWKYWNGSVWTASTLANIATNGNSSSTLTTLSQANWEASGGFVPGTTATLDFAASLTSDGNSWATLSNAPGNVANYSVGLTYFDGNLYAIPSSGNAFWKYNLASSTWVVLPNTPAAQPGCGNLGVK